jgi:hypothetical protein
MTERLLTNEHGPCSMELFLSPLQSSQYIYATRNNTDTI